MKALTVADLGEMFDGPHATPTRREAGPYFLNIASLNGGRLDLSASDHVSDEDYGRWTRRVTPQAGDFLFSYETRLGEAALMPEGVAACLGRRMALIRPAREVVEPRYLLYRYLAPDFQRQIDERAIHGATVDRIGLATMGSWPITVHELGEQRAIAEVLGALDDKIAANDRVVETTDSLVRTWYADVCATAAEERPLLALAENSRRQVQPGLHPNDVYLGLEHLPRRRMWASEWGWAQDVESAKSRFEAGDVLFGKLRPYFHKVVAAPGAGICSTDILVLRPVSGLEGLVLAAASSDDAVELANAHSAGTRMPRASWASLGGLAVPWPGEKEARDFSQRVTRLSDRCLAAVRESQKLSQLRDALLPELMSGRMRVKDAESTVEGVL